MSGGVGPCKGIRLPKEHQQEQENNQGPISKKSPQNAAAATVAASHGGFFTFRQLNALAIIVVFAASGMVSIEDFAFFVFSLIYMYLLSKFAFPTLSSSPATMESRQELFDQQKKLILSLSTLAWELSSDSFFPCYTFSKAFRQVTPKASKQQLPMFFC